MRILIAIGIVFAVFVTFSAYACVRVGAEAERAAERAFRNAGKTEPADGEYIVEYEPSERFSA